MNDFLIFALEEARKYIPFIPSAPINDKVVKFWREVLRTVLGLAFLWMLVASGILFPDFPGKPSFTEKLWLLLFAIANVVLLFFVVQNRLGVFHILIYGNVLIFALSIAIFVSFFFHRGASDKFIFAFISGIVALPLSSMLIGWLAIRFDPVPINSVFLRIAYPKRYAHLKTLQQLAISKGWKIVGLAGAYHSFHIYGSWNNIPFKIISIHAFTKTENTPISDSVLVEMKFGQVFCTLVVSEETIQTSKGLHDYIDQIDHPKHIFLSPSEASSPEQNEHALRIIKHILLSKQNFLNTKTTAITAKNNNLYYRTDNLATFEEGEKILLLLDFLVNLGNQMKNNGFTLD